MFLGNSWTKGVFVIKVYTWRQNKTLDRQSWNSIAANNSICTGEGGKFAEFGGQNSFFNIAPKLNKSFALMHPDFESNLITYIFRNFGVSRTTESDVIFAFVGGT